MRIAGRHQPPKGNPNPLAALSTHPTGEFYQTRLVGPTQALRKESACRTCLQSPCEDCLSVRTGDGRGARGNMKGESCLACSVRWKMSAIWNSRRLVEYDISYRGCPSQSCKTSPRHLARIKKPETDPSINLLAPPQRLWPSTINDHVKITAESSSAMRWYSLPFPIRRSVSMYLT